MEDELKHVPLHPSCPAPPPPPPPPPLVKPVVDLTEIKTLTIEDFQPRHSTSSTSPGTDGADEKKMKRAASTESWTRENFIQAKMRHTDSVTYWRMSVMAAKKYSFWSHVVLIVSLLGSTLSAGVSVISQLFSNNNNCPTSTQQNIIMILNTVLGVVVAFTTGIQINYKLSENAEKFNIQAKECKKMTNRYNECIKKSRVDVKALDKDFDEMVEHLREFPVSIVQEQTEIQKQVEEELNRSEAENRKQLALYEIEYKNLHENKAKTVVHKTKKPQPTPHSTPKLATRHPFLSNHAMIRSFQSFPGALSSPA